MRKTKENKAITLVALVIIIIILLILSGITISSLTNTGLFKKAKLAEEKSETAQSQEKDILKKYEDEIYNYTTNGVWNGEVNKPELMQGMSAIKFTEPTETAEGTVIDTTSSDTEWYNYKDKKWANAKTEDGSMWVWIPRYAYRIHKENGVETQKFDIVFLIGLTDNYYDENNNIQTAQRQTSENQTIVTNGDTYTVHPAFTNESSINYANGGWDKELSGIWVAKFESGYASGNNNAPVKPSTVNYSQKHAWVWREEAGNTNDTVQTARNWLDGEYSVKNGSEYEWKDGKETPIKYPTFQGLTYSMSYISQDDAYRISKVLTENGNIYGLDKNSTDSHLIKNSEWGAVAYLGQSKYGLDGKNIYINNVSISNSIQSVYTVTGCAGNKADASSIRATIGAINNRTQSGIYTWTQKNGTTASSTGTIYGIYDMSGGTSERIAAIINNKNEVLTNYGNKIMEESNNGDKSTKYITIYPHDTDKDNTSISITTENRNKASEANYKKNTKIYGDGIRETSTVGTTKNAWYSDGTTIPALNYPFFIRGRCNWETFNSGLFATNYSNGFSSYSTGFRSVLVSL